MPPPKWKKGALGFRKHVLLIHRIRGAFTLALFLITYAQESRVLKSTRNPTIPKTLANVMNLTLALLAWHLSTAICLCLPNPNEWRVLLFKVLALVCVTTSVRSVQRKNLNGFGLNSETTYKTCNCFLK